MLYTLNAVSLILSYSGMAYLLLYFFAPNWVGMGWFYIGCGIFAALLSLIRTRRVWVYLFGLVVTVGSAVLLCGMAWPTVLYGAGTAAVFTYIFIAAAQPSFHLPRAMIPLGLYVILYVVLFVTRPPSELGNIVSSLGIAYLIATLYRGCVHNIILSSHAKDGAFNRSVGLPSMVILTLITVVGLVVVFFRDLQNLVMGALDAAVTYIINAIGYLIQLLTPNNTREIGDAMGGGDMGMLPFEPVEGGGDPPWLQIVLTIFAVAVTAMAVGFLLYKLGRGLRAVWRKLYALLNKIGETGTRLYVDEHASLMSAERFVGDVKRRIDDAFERWNTPRWQQLQSPAEALRRTYALLGRYGGKTAGDVSHLTPNELARAALPWLGQDYAGALDFLTTHYNRLTYAKAYAPPDCAVLQPLYDTLRGK